MPFIGLAQSHQIKDTSDEKYCKGKDCQKKVPKKDFPKSGGEYCKKCASKNQMKRYAERKANNAMFF